jgi:hypothetical protein
MCLLTFITILGPISDVTIFEMKAVLLDGFFFKQGPAFLAHLYLIQLFYHMVFT